VLLEKERRGESQRKAIANEEKAQKERREFTKEEDLVDSIAE